ncbi:MAG TPA: hypothetical protein DCL77_16985 [Prolixibacteraceae bacterium]|jgi:hypothetical protein|nr:hypothetical protein [Prolixibacteraceae bacterium]
MRKLALIVAAVACFSLGSSAQGMFEKGTQLFKLGVGVNGNGTPLDVSYEKGVKEGLFGVDGLVLGLGGNVGYYGYKENFSNLAGSYSWKYTDLIIAVKGLAHYKLVEKLDTYGGVMLGYNVASVKYDGPNAGSMPSPSVGGVVFGGIVGARYEFNQSFGAYAEAGFGISNLSIGIAYKF